MQIPPFVSLCKYDFWSRERTHSIRAMCWTNDLVRKGRGGEGRAYSCYRSLLTTQLTSSCLTLLSGSWTWEYDLDCGNYSWYCAWHRCVRGCCGCCGHKAHAYKSRRNQNRFAGWTNLHGVRFVAKRQLHNVRRRRRTHRSWFWRWTCWRSVFTVGLRA